VLGLDFGGTKIAAAVCELSGRRLGEATVAIDREQGASGNLGLGIEAGRKLLVSLVPEDALVAVGACTFGIPTTRGIELAPAIPGWGSLALEAELRVAFDGVEVVVANDVKAAAAAEARWGALAGCDPAVYLNLGTGLSVAIVCGGRVVQGAHGAAGEIAYNLRSVADLGLVLEERVLLEDVVSGRALAERGSRIAGRDVAPVELLEADADGTATSGVLEDFLAELCFHMVNLAVTVDPARIAVGGGIVRSWDRVGPRLRGALVAGVPFPPELVVAAFPYDAPLVGALALGIGAARESQETGSLSTDRGRTSP